MAFASGFGMHLDLRAMPREPDITRDDTLLYAETASRLSSCRCSIARHSVRLCTVAPLEKSDVLDAVCGAWFAKSYHHQQRYSATEGGMATPAALVEQANYTEGGAEASLEAPTTHSEPSAPLLRRRVRSIHASLHGLDSHLRDRNALVSTCFHVGFLKGISYTKVTSQKRGRFGN